ncbi:MAG: response regulator [Spirochaetia bacterium]|nr:response regulator [Spirochaetia bacterium]
MALVVDDDAANRDILGRLLERSGWLYDLADNGQAAVDACARTHYDLILLDLFMPGMDGVTCASRIRGLYERADKAPEGSPYTPRIVAVTGSEGPGAEARSLFDAELPKPYSMDELKAILDSCPS